MYSVIEAGGFQHKVTLGESLKLPKMEAEVGSEVSIDKVLLSSHGDNISIGAPQVDGASVKLEVLSHGKGPKIKVFKRKRRKGYRKTAGHRTLYTEVLVTELSSGSANKKLDDASIKRARARIVALAKQKDSTLATQEA